MLPFSRTLTSTLSIPPRNKNGHKKPNQQHLTVAIKSTLTKQHFDFENVQDKMAPVCGFAGYTHIFCAFNFNIFTVDFISLEKSFVISAVSIYDRDSLMAIKESVMDCCDSWSSFRGSSPPEYLPQK